MAKEIIVFEGLDEVLSNLTRIEEKAPQSLAEQTAKLAKDTEAEWRELTPRRSGRMQGEERVVPAGLSFTLENSTYYYPFVDEGHMTPRGWRTKRGYRPAKHRSHVEARLMTERTVEFIEENITDYLSKFLDDL